MSSVQDRGLRVAKNIVSQGVTFGARAASSFIITVLIARLAGAHSLGVYSFAITFTAAATFLTDLGVSLLLVREIARNRDAVQKYINNAFTLSLFLAPVVFLIIAWTIKLSGSSKETVYAVYLSALALVLFSFSAVFKGAFYAYEHMEFQTVTIVVQETTYVAIASIVLYLGLPFLQVFVAYAVSRFLGLVFAWLLYRRYMGSLRLEFDLPFCRDLILKGLPFGANVVLTLVYARAAILLLSFLQGDQAVGYYEAATNFSIHFGVVAQMLNISLLPIMSQEYSSPEVGIIHYVSRSIKYLVIVGLPLTVGLLLMSEKVFTLVYGEGFASVVQGFQILVCAIVFKFANHSLATALTAADLQGKRTMTVAIAAFLNVVLNLYAIPAYSYVGAAMVAIITEAVMFAFLCYFTSKEVGNPWRAQILWRPALASLVMGCAIVAMSYFPLLIVVPVAVIIYVATLYLVRAFSAEEVDTFRGILTEARRSFADVLRRTSRKRATPRPE